MVLLMMLSLIILSSFILYMIYNFLKDNKKMNPTNMLLNSSLVSTTILMFWYLSNTPSMIVKLKWFYWNLNSFKMSLIIDFPFILFSTVGLYVTWSIIEFSSYYMEKDPFKTQFMSTLILFLTFMLILVSSKNLFMLFIGWEGVGMMSFILISWWFTRAEAKSSALQAIIYKRIGDSGMMMFMAMAMLKYKSWKLKEIFFFNNSTMISNMAMMGIILAAAGKSAQFSLHPWLPAAMEGPTPVSALLHSSTMVVAGVFLLFRCSPLLKNLTWATSLISILGATTALFAASAALTQYDMKKMVAYSTTSQLGLMILAMGINIPQLALFHICTHAFFKALLFLCSGSMIHSLNNEQDIRKMGKSSTALPLTKSCITMSSLALCGLPFLAGYYSKDIILEASQMKMTKSISVIIAMLATLMTTIYSLRLMYFLSSPNMKTTPIKPMSEEKQNLSSPLMRLTLGVFVSGWFMALCFMNTKSLMIPWMKKILPLLMLLYTMASFTKNLIPKPAKNKMIQITSKFTSNNWFYVKIIHQKTIMKTFNLSIFGVLRILDQGWTTLLGAKGISFFTVSTTNMIQKAHNAMLSSYFKFLVLIMLSLISLLMLL